VGNFHAKLRRLLCPLQSAGLIARTQQQLLDIFGGNPDKAGLLSARGVRVLLDQPHFRNVTEFEENALRSRL